MDYNMLKNPRSPSQKRGSLFLPQEGLAVCFDLDWTYSFHHQQQDMVRRIPCLFDPRARTIHQKIQLPAADPQPFCMSLPQGAADAPLFRRQISPSPSISLPQRTQWFSLGETCDGGQMQQKRADSRVRRHVSICQALQRPDQQDEQMGIGLFPAERLSALSRRQTRHSEPVAVKAKGIKDSMTVQACTISCLCRKTARTPQGKQFARFPWRAVFGFRHPRQSAIHPSGLRPNERQDAVVLPAIQNGPGPLPGGCGKPVRLLSGGQTCCDFAG